MSTPDPKGLFDKTVAQVLDEQGFVWEESPRSIYDPEQLWIALQRFATDCPEHQGLDSNLEYGFRKAFSIFAKPKDFEPLKILSTEELVNEALHLEKSAGLPLMVSKAKSLNYSMDRAEQILQGIKAPNPCVAYKRTKDGVRLVWGYPLEMVIIEGRFARPLINRFKNMRTPMAFAMTNCHLGANLSRHFEDEKGTTVSLDYSKFDSSVTAAMILEAFRILSTWFSDEDLDRYGWTTLVKYFIHTPIVMLDGHLYTGKTKGVPSGSYFTQLVDSVVNVALAYALAHKFHFYFGRRNIFVLGDDCILQVKGKVELEKWKAYLFNRFGMRINVKKTVVGQVHFLGAIWIKGKPDAPIEELARKAVFPEHYRKYKGNPYRGAMAVIYSYGSNYLSGYKLFPRGNRKFDMRVVDVPLDHREWDEAYMTGSDRIHWLEATMGGRDRRPTSLAERFLL
jgi:hypothetical protein